MIFLPDTGYSQERLVYMENGNHPILCVYGSFPAPWQDYGLMYIGNLGATGTPTDTDLTMEEAAEADYVVILDSGRIAAKGTPLELKNTYTGDFITLYNISEGDAKSLEVDYTPMRDAFRLFVPNTAKATELILAHPEVFRDFEITKGKMDDVFLAVTGKNLTGGVEK